MITKCFAKAETGDFKRAKNYKEKFYIKDGILFRYVCLKNTQAVG